MKYLSKLLTLIIALAMVLQMSAISVYAAGEKDDPHLGGTHYPHADGAGIILNKLDIAKFEREKAAELIKAGQLNEGGKVIYQGNEPLGSSIAADQVIGTYTTSEDGAAKVDVTLGELAALGNIVFRLEQVKLITGRTPGSADVADYELVSGGIDEYSKTDEAGQIKWTGLQNGYYRITEEQNDTGAPVGDSSYIVSLPMVDPTDSSKTINTVHIYPKNRASQGPVVEKLPPSAGDYNGNILSWTIKAEIPATLKAEQGFQKFVVKDTMDKGIQFAGNLKVYYKSGDTEVELTGGSDYSTDAVNGGTSFNVTLGSDGFAKLGAALAAGSIDKDSNDRYILYISYDTVVNISQEDFEANVDPENKVELDFTNSDGTDYENHPGPVVVEKHAGLQVTKKDGSDQNVLLAGAKFKIYTKLSGETVNTDSVLKDAAGKEYEFTTDTAGKFFYSGLGAGSYYIVETAAPGGYKKLSSYTQITITAEDVEGNKIKEATVLNYRDNGFSLPSTGGAGKVMFFIVGVGLIATAVALYLAFRHQAKNSSGVGK